MDVRSLQAIIAPLETFSRDEWMTNECYSTEYIFKAGLRNIGRPPDIGNRPGVVSTTQIKKLELSDIGGFPAVAACFSPFRDESPPDMF